MIDARLKAASIIACAVLFLIVLDLVRRRKLLERYALLWLGSALVLLGLASWTSLLGRLSSAIGIETPSNALFLAAFGFVLILLLHFSIAVSKLTDQSKVLAQRVALLEERQRGLEGDDHEREPEQYVAERSHERA
jgi:hypothetical protein